MKLKDFKGRVRLTDIKDVELAKDIQKALGVTPDGIIGKNTLAAFVLFKDEKHLAEPDILGETTAKILLEPPSHLVSATQARTIFQRSISPKQLADLNRCLVIFNIDTPARMCHFLAQVCHESGNLKWLVELASGAAYEGRRDLGNFFAGDGRKFKGGGAIQLTGRSNYTRFAKAVNDPKVLELGAVYVGANYPFTSAGFWWTDNQMNSLVDAGADVKQITRRVNGGYNGLADRLHHYHRIVKVLG